MSTNRSRPFRTILTALPALLLALTPALPASDAGAKTMKAKPKAVHKVMAEYPAEAREARTEGVVIATVTIERNGSVSAVAIDEGDALFHGSTVAALEQWKFEPLAAVTEFRVTMRYRLDSHEKGAKEKG